MCACARVRVRARARARARSLMATLPGGGPAEDGSELRSHACGVAKVEARGHAPGVGRIVIVTVTPCEVAGERGDEEEDHLGHRTGPVARTDVSRLHISGTRLTSE